ncbi:MAG: hypothetical protein JNN03_20855 [Rubrivivax sp.]|nr:hypothetical protein [Rubrivivax sp.]
MLQHPATLERARRFNRAPRLRPFGELLAAPSNAPGLALPQGGLEECERFAQMAHADAADASLLRLVLCAAGATLALAVASSLM